MNRSNRTLTKILLVDDQENWRDALTSILAGEGYSVEAVAGLEEAMDMVSQCALDLVILDVRLADRDTFDVRGIELLRFTKAQKSAPKVIVLTGYPESVNDGILERYGADALLLKVPQGSRFDTEGFKERVRELLEEERVKLA
jgi:CheY-like chemotaxis protein